MTGINWALIGIIVVADVLFGCLYAVGVNRIGKRQEGFLSFLVAIGVGITLVGTFALDWRFALITYGFFAATGIPMMIASVVKYITLREQARKFEREKTDPILREIYRD